MPPWPATRWPLTFGPALLGLAAVASLLSCARGQDWTPQGVERQRRACARTKEFPPARTPGDTKTRFASLLAGESFQEFGPQVLSTDPLIVYFDTFMSEEEVAACEAEVSSLEFAKSKAGYGGNAQGRLSESAFCIHNCDSSDIVQKVQRRASNISGVPIENFDFMQALRYQEGNFFTAHHDNHPTFHLLPCGSRIFSFFVYLSDVGLEGGATNFPDVNISVPAKRGAAVLFANVMDDDPTRTDTRSTHESVPVTKGEKRGLNLWVYQYNFRHFWSRGCTTIELADQLGRIGKAAVAGEGEEALPQEPESAEQPTVIFNNPRKTDLIIYWIDHKGEEILVSLARAGQGTSLNSFPGHRFLVRNEAGKLVAKHKTNRKAVQHVELPQAKKRPASSSAEDL